VNHLDGRSFYMVFYVRIVVETPPRYDGRYIGARRKVDSGYAHFEEKGVSRVEGNGGADWSRVPGADDREGRGHDARDEFIPVSVVDGEPHLGADQPFRTHIEVERVELECHSRIELIGPLKLRASAEPDEIVRHGVTVIEEEEVFSRHTLACIKPGEATTSRLAGVPKEAFVRHHPGEGRRVFNGTARRHRCFWWDCDGRRLADGCLPGARFEGRGRRK